MRITLTRYLCNRTYVHGKMTVEGLDDTFETMELAVPEDKFSYVKHCLPPGKYPLQVQLSVISLSKGSVRRPWILFKKIKWFPKAALYSNFEDHSLLSGRIFIGLTSKDEWSVEQDDVVTAKIIGALEKIYDSRTDEISEDVILEIIEASDMEVHNYDRRQYENQLRAEQEQKDKEEAEKRFRELSQA